MDVQQESHLALNAVYYLTQECNKPFSQTLPLNTKLSVLMTGAGQ